MTKLNRTQLRSLIREAIDDVQSEKNAALLKKKVQIRIIERKLSNFSETLNAASELSLVNEGLFDNIRGGLGVMASTLGRAAFGDWAGGKGYQGYGGLTSDELKKIGNTMPMKNLNSAIKSVEPALKRLKSTKMGELIDGMGLIALDGYIKSVTDVFENMAAAQKQANDEDLVLEDSLYEKVRNIYIQSFEIVKQLQKDIQKVVGTLESEYKKYSDSMKALEPK